MGLPLSYGVKYPAGYLILAAFAKCRNGSIPADGPLFAEIKAQVKEGRGYEE